jgi:ABC-type Fe3+/spermidine/putrescine transport system ATPase subunit
MMLQVCEVTKKYSNQKRPAIHHVSLALAKGKSMAIIGESGSGKTTLLKMIAGLIDTDSGKVFLHQKEVFGSAYTLVPGHKKIKLLQQDFNLMPRHKISENIAYYLRLLPQEEQNQRVNQLLTWFDLQEVAEKYPAELSGGQQQRAALAVALADEPDLLLLDEPFSHLDTRLKVKLRSEITQTLHKIGMAFILVTHDIQDAFYMTDEAAIMYEGHILQQGTMIELFEMPRNIYVAELLGYTNIFPIQKIDFLFKEKATATKKFVAIHSKNIHIQHLTTTQAENTEITTHSKKITTTGTVQKAIFLGNFYEITIVIETVTLIAHSPKAWKIQEKVKLYIENIVLLDS